MVGAWAEAIVMPGRIGLVAVEALVLNIPIVSTDYPHHAPEAEYLKLGASRFDAPNEPKQYAEYLRRFLLSPPERGERAEFPTLEGMVERYRAGVLTLLATEQKARKKKGRKRIAPTSK
jgi:hypothetical protein